VTRTELPGSDADVVAPPVATPSRSAAELRRIRRGVHRRTVRLRRRSYVLTRRIVARAVHAWRSSLQVRIGAITMLVAGTVVVIVSMVLFSQIRDQLLRVKREAAIDQAQAGVVYAESQVAGIATGDAASVRSALSRTVTQLISRRGAAGDFDVVMIRRTGEVPRVVESRPLLRRALPDDLRGARDHGQIVSADRSSPTNSGVRRKPMNRAKVTRR
jgi:two-component system sensor histidine kinase MtrB